MPTTKFTDDQVRDALTQARGNVSAAARTLGVYRQSVYERMVKLGITIKRRQTATIVEDKKP